MEDLVKTFRPVVIKTEALLSYHTECLKLFSFPYLNGFLKNMGHSRPFFFISVFSIQSTVNLQCKFLPMTRFEPRTSGIGSEHSSN